MCQAEHRGLVEEIYRRMNERDFGVIEHFHPEVEWHWPANSPGPSVYRGHEGLEQGLRIWTESWGDFPMHPEEMIESGDKARRRFLAGDRPS